MSDGHPIHWHLPATCSMVPASVYLAIVDHTRLRVLDLVHLLPRDVDNPPLQAGLYVMPFQANCASGHARFVLRVEQMQRSTDAVGGMWHYEIARWRLVCEGREASREPFTMGARGKLTDQYYMPFGFRFASGGNTATLSCVLSDGTQDYFDSLLLVRPPLRRVTPVSLIDLGD